MVKHIVMFRLEGADKAAKAADFKKAIEALPATISQLESAEVGINDGPTCRAFADLATYATHPAHLACVAIIKPLLAARACVDYTL